MDSNEEERLAALRRYPFDIERRQPVLQQVAVMARSILKSDYSFVSFIAEEKVWFEAHDGFPEDFLLEEVDRNQSLSRFVLEAGTPVAIPDTAITPETSDLPLVIGDPFLRSFAGTPITTSDNLIVGVLSIGNLEPHIFSTPEIDQLNAFAELASRALDLSISNQPEPIFSIDGEQALDDEQAMERFRDLHRKMFTICAWTKRIRYQDEWMDFEEFLKKCLDIRFTHGISEEAYDKLMQESVQQKPMENRVGSS